jgi:acetyl-CoA acetyltransferase
LIKISVPVFIAIENNPSMENNTGGRPPKYKPEYAPQAKRLCMLGLTDAQLADYFEVTRETINAWKRSHRLFADALKAGKIDADTKVVQGLYKRAVGIKYKETTFEKIFLDSKTANQEDISVPAFKKKVVTKFVVPDVGAAMNWLKNRQQLLWRDRQEIDFNNLTDEQLDMLLSRITAKASQKTSQDAPQ